MLSQQSVINHDKSTSTLKDRFEAFFLWASPLGLIADLISIWGLVHFKNQTVIDQLSSPSPNYVQPKVLGFLGVTDAIVLTGFITLFIVVSTIYGSVLVARSQDNRWSYIWGSFIVLILSWSYFRLWLGEYGWIWILVAFVLVCAITTYLLFNIDSFPQIYRVGCIVGTISLVILTIFLMATTGAWIRMANFIHSSSATLQPAVVPVGLTPALEMVLPTLATGSETQSLSFSSYVPYELSAQTWFPQPQEFWTGLTAGPVGEVTNQKASWGSTDSLRLFESWGRITSFERFYTHPIGCGSPDLTSVYIQVIFFQSADGSKSFFDWANEGAVIRFVNTVGDNAYVYSEKRTENGCAIALVSTTFQRYNVIARARVNSIDGKMGEDTAEALSLKIARLIDERLKSAAK